MQFNFEPVGTMIARFIEHHVSIRHQKQTAVPLEKETGGVG
jgi:hypothetical protein